MKRIIYIITFCLIVAVITACELVVDIDVPFDGKQLTINSFFSPDSTWSASVSRNRFILDEEPFDMVTDALVVIADESGPVDTLEHVFNGYYRSAEKPQPGKAYTITAFHPSNGTATGHSQIPPATEIIDARLQTTTVENEQRTNFNVTFRDDATTENYYEVFVLQGSEWVNSITKEIETNVYPVSLETNDPVLANTSIRSGERFLLKDVFYGGSEINLSFYTYGWIDRAAVLKIIVRSVTAEYYQYVTTMDLQKETSGNPFAQPVNVYGNIENGFGVFAGIRNTSKVFSAPPFSISSVSPGAVRRGDLVEVTLENITILPQDQMHISAILEGQQYLIYTYVAERTNNTIRFTVPHAARTGKLWISINGRIAEWHQEFVVLP